LLFWHTPRACAGDGEDAAIADAKKRQAIAEAEAAEAKARLGAITAATPKGTATVDGLSVEGKIRAYRAAATAADEITKDVLSAKPTAIVFFSAKEIADITTYRAFLRQADLVQSLALPLVLPPLFADQPSGTSCVPPPRVATKAIPPLVGIDAALQVLSLFKADRSIKGADVTLDEFAVAALVAERLIDKVTVVYPPSYYPSAFQQGATPELDKRFNALTALLQAHIKFSLQISARRQEVAALAETAEARKDPVCKQRYVEDLAALDLVQARVKAIAVALDQLFANFVKADAQTGLTLLQTLAAAEQLATQFKSAHVLQLRAVAAGGATMTKTNIFRTRILFSGGAVIAYMLFADTGAIVKAGTVPVYGGVVPETEMK
jgi:hypothetical protein